MKVILQVEVQSKDWRMIVRELLAAEGRVPPKLVCWISWTSVFLYDYIKTLLEVGTDDLRSRSAYSTMFDKFFCERIKSEIRKEPK
jgi:hypothetical protein